MRNNDIPKKAYVMIIGSMKCGTSSLFDYLKDHPNIAPSKEKEPEFFSENQGHGTSEKEYTNLYSFDPNKHKYVLEASTGYTKFPMEENVPKNISEYGINPRFIYVVRNPFDRIVSHFNFKKVDDSWSHSINAKHLINCSNYHLQLSRFREFFPKESFLLLDFDELIKSPEKVLKKVYAFLELEPSYFPEEYAVKNKTNNIKWKEKEIKNKYKNVLRFIPGRYKGKVTRKLTMMFPPQKHVLSKSQYDMIYDELQESMYLLQEDYGVDVVKWGFEK